MSFDVIRTSVSPLLYTYQAYKSTQYDFNLMSVSHTGTIARVYKGTQEYEDTIKLLPGHSIKEAMQPFFDKIGLRKDVIVCERVNPMICAAKGTNYFTKGDAAIFVSPGLEEKDKNACYFIMKHEASHIKNNDHFNILAMKAVLSATVAIATFIFSKFTAVKCATFVAAIVAGSAYSQYCEGKADDLAIAESSIEELKGGRRYFIGLAGHHMYKKKTFFESLMISSTGENRIDILHPSLKSRTKKIEDALERRGVDPKLSTREIENIIRLGFFIRKVVEDAELEISEAGIFKSIAAEFQ